MKDGDDVSKLFIFDTRLGPTEETEHEKVHCGWVSCSRRPRETHRARCALRGVQILFYYPASATLDQQQTDVGLCEALINFTRTFSPDKPCRAVHTDQHRQVLWEAEPCVWMVLVVNRANPPKRDSDSYAHDEMSSQELDSILRNAHQMLTLFNGTMGDIVAAEGAEGLRRKLSLLMPSYISTLPPISKLDLPFSLGGVRYFPVDRQTFLGLQSFFHLAVQDFPALRFGLCLYQDMLVWSSLPNGNDMKVLCKICLSHHHLPIPQQQEAPHILSERARCPYRIFVFILDGGRASSRA